MIFNIDSAQIGGERTIVIAEVGVNHFGRIELSYGTPYKKRLD